MVNVVTRQLSFCGPRTPQSEHSFAFSRCHQVWTSHHQNHRSPNNWRKKNKNCWKDITKYLWKKSDFSRYYSIMMYSWHSLRKVWPTSSSWLIQLSYHYISSKSSEWKNLGLDSTSESTHSPTWSPVTSYLHCYNQFHLTSSFSGVWLLLVSQLCWWDPLKCLILKTTFT